MLKISLHTYTKLSWAQLSLFKDSVATLMTDCVISAEPALDRIVMMLNSDGIDALLIAEDGVDVLYLIGRKNNAETYYCYIGTAEADVDSHLSFDDPDDDHEAHELGCDLYEKGLTATAAAGDAYDYHSPRV
ncbi:hypothetical protein [Roseovarius sp. THAF27]|uniref:hypothetical protein n=1 Tax=Roseovarius sp. THAF27 TaxID=2587850 RepID=UPI00156293E1|nr:hypothetical protein [Roseovarius sp. THAF27]